MSFGDTCKDHDRVSKTEVLEYSGERYMCHLKGATVESRDEQVQRIINTATARLSSASRTLSRTSRSGWRLLSMLPNALRA